MESKTRLVELIRKLSFQTGDFTLASGLKSSFYLDLKQTTLHPEGATLCGELGVKTLEDAKVRVDAVGGLTLGADPIATSLSLAAFKRGHAWPALIVRKESKSHGTSEFVEGKKNVKPGGSVVVVEDVSTTGKSAWLAVERLRGEGFKVEGVLTVCDREQGAKEFFKEKGLWFLSLVKFSDIHNEVKR